ncbi:hypothetical protein ABE03_01630 [Bacillus thuringiensis]|nr:hypothetical protein [Bacillus thuringiensis]
MHYLGKTYIEIVEYTKLIDSYWYLKTKFYYLKMEGCGNVKFNQIIKGLLLYFWGRIFYEYTKL